MTFLAVGLFGCTASAAGPTRVAINNPDPDTDIYLSKMAPSSGSDESDAEIRRNVPKDFRTPVVVGNVARATSAVPFAIEYSDFRVVPLP